MAADLVVLLCLAAAAAAVEGEARPGPGMGKESGDDAEPRVPEPWGAGSPVAQCAGGGNPARGWLPTRSLSVSRGAELPLAPAGRASRSPAAGGSRCW